MRDFLDLLKFIYAICAVFCIVVILIGTPIVLAIEFNPWWIVAEVVTFPVGFAFLMWGVCKTSEM